MLFEEGASGACLDLAHELAHLRHFQRDRKASPNEEAFESLEDNDLITHNAAYEIEAVLTESAVAQEPLAIGRR